MDMLASLDVQVERMIADGWTVEELMERYRAVLVRQLNDWNQRKGYFNKMIMSVRE